MKLYNNTCKRVVPEWKEKNKACRWLFAVNSQESAVDLFSALVDRNKIAFSPTTSLATWFRADPLKQRNPLEDLS